MLYEKSQPKNTNYVSVNSLIQTKKSIGVGIFSPSATPIQAKIAEKKPEHTVSIQKEANHTGLPDKLKTGVENLSGFSMDDVQVRYNSPKPAQLQALAYTRGTDIYVAPGQEQNLPHEAWHVVQQKQERVSPTAKMKGLWLNDNEGLEREADEMGEKAKSGKQPANLITQIKNNADSVIQRFKKLTSDPLAEKDAVKKRKEEVGISRKCIAVVKIKKKDFGDWSTPKTAISSGTPGPQGHSERMALNQFVEGMIDKTPDNYPFGRDINVQEGSQAGKLINSAGISDVDVYTELPPCWGCEPWLTEIDKNISGEVTSRHSLLLTNYYQDYDRLKSIKFSDFSDLNGTDALFDYHIGYTLGNERIIKDSYLALSEHKYEPLRINMNLDTNQEFLLKQDQLLSLVFRNYDSIVLMGKETGNTEFYYGWVTELANKVKATGPIYILNYFEAIKGQVEKDEQDLFQRIRENYLKVTEML